ncbi:MAG TPA: thrombospondin type 3 repeat-containing protein, partial [Pyrinomonadaceae bacterium]
CYASWNDIVSANQTAVITGGFGVNVGGGNPGMTAAADALHIAYGTSCFTYDFDVDSDGDRIADAADNCPTAANADQADADGDDIGDVCDNDDDNDNVADANDLCPNTPAGTTVGATGCPVASAKEQCKNGGWQTFTRANGSPFKNQGDCVSYVSNGK